MGALETGPLARIPTGALILQAQEVTERSREEKAAAACPDLLTGLPTADNLLDHVKLALSREPTRGSIFAVPSSTPTASRSQR